MQASIKVNFKQKQLIISKISMSYKKSSLKDDLFSVNEENHPYLNEENYYLNIKNKVDYILLQMDNNLSMIIYNDFFSRKVDGWWMYYFSKSTYYRLKNKAMNNFLEWWYA